jgi:hypothetical protein
LKISFGLIFLQVAKISHTGKGKAKASKKMNFLKDE